MAADCLLVTPPFSPNTSNPLLGPGILKAHAQEAGFELRNIDLNISYISSFERGPDRKGDVVGDHNADERQIDRAREHFTKSLRLPDAKPCQVPCCDDPNSSLPHSFDEIETALQEIKSEGYWPAFFQRHIFSQSSEPALVGISIMGPAQVPLALLLASLTKLYWPGATVIAGGSHITLLASRIAKDPRYAGDIDYFVPGHSEDVLIGLLERLAAGAPLEIDGTIRAGKPWRRSAGIAPDRRLAPVFEESELAFYRKGRLTLPMQLARGCSYGRCTYCTYPVVEEFERVSSNQMAERFLPPALQLNPHSISVKDSLLTLPSMDGFGRTIHELSPAVSWSATTKVNLGMKPERMRDLYDMGCRTLEMGIETIHPGSQRFFDKIEPLKDIEAALDATLSAGITVVINMIYGIPGETLDDANRQISWWRSWKERYPGQVFGVHNMLQIDEGSPLARDPGRFGLKLGGCGPWSFTYVWNAPEWRPVFEKQISDSGGRAQ